MENNKPMTLVREDFIAGVAMMINQSGLPLFVIEDTLRQLLNGVSELARQQLEQDKQMYMKAMMETQKKDDESAQTEVSENK